MRKVKFNEDSLEINQYEFQISTIRENPIIHAKDINEACFNTFPYSFVIHSNEIIFIEERYNDAFEEFVNKNNIKISQRVDLWKLINEVFLETKFSNEHYEETLKTLAEFGLSKQDIAQIRQKVGELMSGWGGVSWKSDYLGHYDLLLNKKQSFLLLFPKDFYWWSMEIALKNFK
jgi:hypothetical protein